MASERRLTKDDPFRARVLAVVRRIPPGRVATYGDVATLAGRPGAARAVGTMMRRSGPDIPAHRVIAAGGRLGGYGGHEVLKRALLAAEGVPFVGARVAIATCRVPLRSTGRPGTRRRA